MAVTSRHCYFGSNAVQEIQNNEVGRKPRKTVGLGDAKLTELAGATHPSDQL